MKVKRFLTRGIAVLLLILVPSTGFAATYYIDATGGSNTNDGLTTGTAWQTIAKVSGTTFTAGDTILFKRGETFTGSLQFSNESGTSNNYITVGAYGTGADPIFNATGQSRGIDLRNSASYFRFQNLDLRNATTDMIFVFTGTFTGNEFIDLTISSTTSGFTPNTATTTSTLFQNITVSSTTNGINLTSPSINDRIENFTMTGGSQGIRVSPSISTASSSNLTIDGATLSNQAGDAITITRAEDITVNDVTITNPGSDGIFIQTLVDEATFSNLSITGAGDYGFRKDNPSINITLATSTITDSDEHGIYFTSLYGTTLLHNIISSDNTGAGAFLSGANGASTIRVSSSTFNGNGDVGLQNGLAFGGTGFATTSSTTASFNTNDGFNITSSINAEFYHTISEGNGVDGQSSDGDGYSWHNTSTGVLAYSKAINNKKGGVVNVDTSNVDIYNNIFTHTTAGTLAMVYIDASDAEIYNNTFYNGSGQGRGIQILDPSNASVRNNLIYGFADGIYDDTNGTLTESNNLVFGNSGTAFVNFTQDSSTLTVDPQFIDAASGNFRLTTGSPAVNAGSSLLCPTDDYDGVTRDTCDIGAFEGELASGGGSSKKLATPPKPTLTVDPKGTGAVIIGAYDDDNIITDETGFEYWNEEDDEDDAERIVFNNAPDSFKYTLRDLSCNETYVVRGYAKNSKATSYSDEIEFTINDCDGETADEDDDTEAHSENTTLADLLRTFRQAVAKNAPTDLKRGARGSDVLWLQGLLIVEGKGGAATALTQTGLTGYFGVQTENSLIEYQKAYGIMPAVGYYGPVTRTFLAQ